MQKIRTSHQTRDGLASDARVARTAKNAPRHANRPKSGEIDWPMLGYKNKIVNEYRWVGSKR